MTPEEAARAFNDGSIYHKTPDELREMLKAVAHARATNPNYAHHMTQCAELIRHLLTSHEQAAALAEARGQHTLSFHLGKRTLRWTTVAAIAAVIAALAALWPLFISLFHH